ncbi:MerR family transcriptional regulator [Amycolatopsis sp. SB7-3]|uniref:MerR family transcriptional regulator n=1 Tax=Amycolatopsis sp. SB7-3 TaxID=3373438 RepID=UPI0037441DF3
MAWSTRELADLAGTTLKTVRYYHRIGLLDEPERGANGYKRYRVMHLIRLLRIRRLVDLGVPLSDIEAMEESEGNAERTLRALDAELKASIERQQRMRKELALILERRSLVDLPPGFDGDVADLSEVERSMLMVFSRVLDAKAMEAVRELHAVPRSPAQAELDALPADADEVTRRRVAEELLPVARGQIEAQPSLVDATTQAALAAPMVVRGLAELYNPAQLDVLRRLNALLQQEEKGP